jgi:hypothetical protein
MPTSQTQPAWPLHKPQQLVYIDLGLDNGGMMLGICELGFSFRAVSPLKSEGPVQFTFALDGKTRLQGTGEIVWSEEGGKTGGLRFTTVSPQFRESLRDWLAGESTPKSVGREVTPAISLPLDSPAKSKEDVHSTVAEDAAPAAPQSAPETKSAAPKPIVPAPVASIAVKPVVPIPIEQKPSEAKPVEHVQPEQLVHEPETHVPEPALPQHLELPPVEAKPGPPQLEPPEPVAFSTEPIAPERELRTVAPLPSAEVVPESGFSLPNFRLPSATVSNLPTVPHLPMEEIVQAAVKTSPIEMSPSAPPALETQLPGLHTNFREPLPPETEAPALPRERASHEVFPEDFVAESPRLNRAAAAGIIGLALGVILTALVFSFRREAGEVLIRLGQSLAGEERKPATPQQAVPTPQNPQPNVAQPSDKPASAQPEPSSAAAQTLASNANSTNVSPSTSPTANGVQHIEDLPPPTDGGSGEKEFQQARNILKGNHRQRDFSLAVRLLWTGVRKGNVPAEVTLADLYARGDGVARSCEQARVLLEAAVQKGSPEARRRFALLKQQGCS